MDVDAALSLANAAAGGAAGAAGQSAWQSLVSLVRRDRGRDVAETAEAEAGGNGPERGGEQARLLYGRIVERARADEEFAGLLCRWAEEHGGALRGDHSRVSNSIPGDATVHGPVIQARDIQGGIHLH